MTPSMAQIMDPETRRQLNLDGLRQYVQGKETDISFHGEVLDQDGNPVTDATVELSLTHFSALSEGFRAMSPISMTTSETGAFVVEGKRGISLSIQAISKEGYEYRRDQNPQTSFEYWPGLTKPFVPDRNNPVVFRLRKRSETTFLITGGGLGHRFSVRETTGTAEARMQALGYDFMRKFPIADLNRPVLNREPLHPDLLVIASYNEQTTSWTIVLAPGDAGGGILASEEMLYEAPADGYQPDFRFPAVFMKPPKARYLYLRSRDPVIYTRIEIVDVSFDKEFLSVGFTSATNPYGERVLDTVPDIPYEVSTPLSREVREAFRKGERPVKPDLPRLIQEAKEKEAIDR
jgi:hypothetical protein